jgi:hypothetical protein
VKDGAIDNYQFVDGFANDMSCDVTNRDWKGCNIVLSYPPIYLNEKIPYKGFQGFRYIDMDLLQQLENAEDQNIKLGIKDELYDVEEGKKKNIVLDIDGVIFEYDHYVKNEWGTPIQDAKEMIDKLREKYNVILFTSRGEDEKEKLIEHLKQHEIEYDELNMNKPIAEFYIDDRALRFDSWDKIDQDVKSLGERDGIKSEAQAPPSYDSQGQVVYHRRTKRPVQVNQMVEPQNFAIKDFPEVLQQGTDYAVREVKPDMILVDIGKNPWQGVWFPIGYFKIK